jgi:hypothetical protein
LLGYLPHRLIGAFDARTVSEDDEPGHTWISDGVVDESWRSCGK